MTKDAAPWAVVTGASRGIGRATAEALAARGVNLALVGRSLDALSASDSACRAQVNTRLFAADFADLPAVEGLALELAQLKPAFLFNVAGVIRRSAIEQLGTSEMVEQFHVNLFAPMLLTRALLPSIRSAKRGAVINVGSISSTLGTARQTVYNASKWALIGFTKSLALELTDSSAHTVVVLPGAVNTDMLQGSPFPARMTPEEVATTLVHYALDASSAHNGASIEMFGT
jgi:3-oxoacyl-[acyl-carrier protein] reductase